MNVLRLLLLASALIWMGENARAEDLRLLQRKGELFAGKEAKPVPAERTRLPRETWLRSGAEVPDFTELKKGDLERILAEPPSSAVAVWIAPGQVVTLSAGATLQTGEDDSGRTRLTLAGAAGILLAAPEGSPPLTIAIGNTVLRTSRVHLFYNGWAQPARLMVVSGEATLLPAKPAKKIEEEKGKEAKIPPELVLREGNVLLLAPGAPIAPMVEAPAKADQRMRRWAEMPGFQTPGSYKRIGEARPSDRRLRIVRYGVEVELTGKAIPLMEGDEVKSRKPQKVLIRFDNGDRVELLGDATFRIEKHLSARKEKKRKENLLFRLFGKMRALFVPREDAATIRFSTVTAVIGVKGTDFETLAGAADTKVSVLDGLLGVTDPTGRGAVDVPAGTFTSVPQGQLPAPPQPIPPDELQRLRSESIPAESMSIQSPAEGAVLRTETLGAIAYESAPPGAPLEVLLDDRPMDAPSGTPLPALPDGPHRLTVKAAGLDEPSMTVSFLIDTTPPALAMDGPEDGAVGGAVAALIFTPGEPLALSWSEPLQTLEVSAGDVRIPSELSQDGKQAFLTPNPEMFQPEKPLPIRFRALDIAGNEIVLDGALLLKAPSNLLQVTIGDGEPTLRAEKAGDVEVSVNGEIAKWTILIDEKDVTEKLPPPKEGEALSNEITLPASLFAEWKPGEHTLTVKALGTDGREGSATVRITLLAPPATPEPEKEKAEPRPGASLKERYEGTIARDTGYPLDELYLNERGPFFDTLGFEGNPPPEPPGKNLYPALPPYEPGFLRALDDPFFRRHSVEAEEGTPVPVEDIELKDR